MILRAGYLEACVLELSQLSFAGLLACVSLLVRANKVLPYFDQVQTCIGVDAVVAPARLVVPLA